MTKYSERILRKIYKRIVGAMSGLSEIDVDIHPNVIPHYIPDQNKIVMPLTIPYASDDNDDFEFGRGTLVHESGHVLFCPDITEITESITDDKERRDFLEWFNIIADANNEYKVGVLFPHLKQPLATKTEKLFEACPQMAKTDNPFAQVLWRIDRVAKINYGYPDKYPDIYKNFVEKWVSFLNNNNVCEATGSELIWYAKQINKDWQILNKSDNPATSKAFQKLMKALADAIKKGDLKAEQDINDKMDKLVKQKPTFKDANPVGNTPRQAGLWANEDLKTLVKELKKKGMEKSKDAGMKGAPPLTEDVEVIDIQEFYEKFGRSQSCPTLLKNAYKRGKNIHRKLKREVRLEKDFESRHRSGNIDIDEVRRQVSQSGRITKPTIHQRDNEYTRGGLWAISVICDLSVSMGPFMAKVKEAFNTLSYALDGLPNVKWELSGYSSQNNTTIVMCKKFRERKMDIHKIQGLHSFGGTPTGKAMAESLRRVMKFTDRKKIMIVITDGEPANPSLVKSISKRAEVNHVNVIGIGIGYDDVIQENVEGLFPTSYVIKDMDRFDKDLPKMILTALHRQRDGIKLVRRVWEK